MYGFTTTLTGITFDQALAKTLAALKAEGFGVLSDDLDDQGQLDELLVDGVVSFSEEEHGWVAAIDWAAVRHASAGPTSPVGENGTSHSSPVAESGRTGRRA